jgi:Ni,Fe-hydrogenase III large subunit
MRGIIEPGHFRFGVAGEPVLYLQLRLFYVHKGIEEALRTTAVAAHVVSGGVDLRGHSMSATRSPTPTAIERLAGVEVPARAQVLRVVLLELERMYNHIADIGALATDVAFTRACQHVRRPSGKAWSGCTSACSGTRLLRGTIAFGGAKHDSDT